MSEGKRTPSLLLRGAPSGNQKDHDRNRLFDSARQKIGPIEVKSSGSSSIKSLVRFKEKFEKRIGEAIVLHHGEIKQQDDVWYLPYYMATLL